MLGPQSLGADNERWSLLRARGEVGSLDLAMESECYLVDVIF
jgi:hypothetical protein